MGNNGDEGLPAAPWYHQWCVNPLMTLSVREVNESIVDVSMRHTDIFSVGMFFHTIAVDGERQPPHRSERESLV